jgi:hypothetical protein
VAVGDVLALEPKSSRWQLLPINFDKLQTTSVTLPTVPMDDAAFLNFARTASVLEKPESDPQSRWSPILVQIYGVRGDAAPWRCRFGTKTSGIRSISCSSRSRSAR